MEPMVHATAPRTLALGVTSGIDSKPVSVPVTLASRGIKTVLVALTECNILKLWHTCRDLEYQSTEILGE